MRPSDDKLNYDLPSNRATMGATVYPAKDTGFRMWPGRGGKAIENRFPAATDRRLMSGSLPPFYHRTAVGDLHAQDLRDRLDALRLIRANAGDRRGVRAIDAVLNGPSHELTSRGRELLG